MKKKYQIIYADPPWKYKTTQHQGAKSGYRNQGYLKYHNEVYQKGAKNQYSCMGMEELKELPIESISDNNCLLFLWVCSPLLKQGIEVGESWGFEYKTIAFVWYKQIHNPGFYTMSECEIVLVFKKGNIPQPRGLRNIRQFWAENRTKHSQKPNEIRNRITKMFPTQNKIELFARQKTEGWDVWGNEIESDIDINPPQK